MKTIGTAIIVKNEAAVIRRCLASLIPMVDYFLVVDTGSSDGTQQVIRDFLAEHSLRGEVIDEPWRDFAHNRTSVLAHLRQHRDIDYALIIDADDELVLHDGFAPERFKSQMECDLYDVEIRYGANRYHRPQILANRANFFFRGVLHEFVEGPPEGFSRADAAGFHILVRGGGARSEDPDKFRRDAALLERALETEKDAFLVSRYTFYLAQSYRDCGEKKKALDYYLKRADQGFWIEEVFVSLYEAAKLQAALQYPPDAVIATFLRAAATVPTRAEALHGASRYCREIRRHDEGRVYSSRGVTIPLPPVGLFVETWIYDYGMLDELAINAYWSGAYRESIDACLRILACGKLPPSEIDRVVANARRALAAESAATASAPSLATKPKQTRMSGVSKSTYGRWSVNPPTLPKMTHAGGTGQAFDRAAIQRLLQEIGTGLLFGGEAQIAIDRLMAWGAPEIEARRIVETAIADPLIVNGREMALMLRRRDWLLESLERHRELSPRAKSIERRSELSGGEFLEFYYARNRPVVIQGEMTRWPALSKWTIDFLQAAAGQLPHGGMAVDAKDDLAVEIAMTADDFAPLADDLGKLEKFLDRSAPPNGGVLRIAQAGAFMPMRSQPRNCLLAQITGRTQLKLASAAEVARIYSQNGVESEIADLDARDFDKRRFPMLAEIRIYDVILDAGEILFLPMAWWHQIRTLEFGITASFVNFRWPNDFDRNFPKQVGPRMS